MDTIEPKLSTFCNCTIRTLDESLRFNAAATAIELNPFNSPLGRVLATGHYERDIAPDAMAMMTSRYWGKQGVHLTVGFFDSPSDALKKRILFHMNAWSEYANVSFAETAGDANVRISFDPNRRPGGYWSNLGTDILQVPLNTPTMHLQGFSNATNDVELRRVVRHETGHTLGCPHEHRRAQLVSRIDREKAIEYFKRTEGWSEAVVESQVLTPLENSALMATAQPDPQSIMCYALPADIMKDGISVPGGLDINNQDAQFICTIYPRPPFRPVYQEIDPGNGIGGYDLRSPADRAFAFDYNSSGKLDHIALYRPGTGIFWILENNNATFTAVYTSGTHNAGIGGYDLASGADRAFAFDFDSSGKQDHIALYRPGIGIFRILKNDGGTFGTAYDGGNAGIGGYDLASPDDRAFAFDYDHSGKLDHLVLYRPGNGILRILKHTGGAFVQVPAGIANTGIGGFDLMRPNDRAFAFDHTGSGSPDHLVLYRPGSGAISIVQNNSGQFSPVYQQIDPGNGIGGYDLRSAADIAFAHDFDGSGKRNHIVLMRPGTGAFCILKRRGDTFEPVFNEIDPGHGVGGFDLARPADRGCAFDFDHSGSANDIVLYRPGSGACFILKRTP